MSSLSIDVELLFKTGKYSLSVNYIVLIFGFIGNFLNILVFTNLKIFRGNRCAFYLIADSIVSISLLCHMCIEQILITIYGNAPEDSLLIWCKLRNISGQAFRLVSSSIVCFEAFDQFLSTNSHFQLRQLSTLKLAPYLIWIAFALWTFHTIPIVIFSGIDPVLGCTSLSDVLTRYYSFFYYPFLRGCLPIFISSLFSILAYRSVRRLIRLQIPIKRRRLDRQLTAMVFARAILFVILLSPYTIFRIYMLYFAITGTNILKFAINRWIYTIVVSFRNIDYTISFYVFLISSSRYRRQVKYFLLKKCWQSLKRRCHSNRNAIHPTDRISNAVSNELE